MLFSTNELEKSISNFLKQYENQSQQIFIQDSQITPFISALSLHLYSFFDSQYLSNFENECLLILNEQRDKKENLQPHLFDLD